MMKWEYAIFRIEAHYFDEVTARQKLNHIGQMGWEIITAHPISGGWVYHTKRPLVENPAANMTIDLGQPADKP